MIMPRAVVAFTGELLKLASLRPGEIVSVASNDVPADAKLICCSYHQETDQFLLTIESDELPQSIEGLPLPRLRGPMFAIRTGVDT